ncbi:MAG TPA: hypothetical protein VKP30_24800 [Polyangiaceae bacterium]|nr:hypothetical protein [Polyangiaceae bacterium]
MPQTVTRVTVDSASRYQTLTGFGASLAYAEVEVLNHPRRTALYRAMFAELGLDMLRLRNRYGYVADDDLSTSTSVVNAAAESLGRKPEVILTSWSPPASLKASGQLICEGNADTCTLAKLATGGFDYAGYAAYWRSSLDAYAEVGLIPEYFGIQNNPDFVPTSAQPGEGCRFLPTEGKLTVPVNGANVAVDYPGLAQATSAVLDAVAGVAAPPKLIAPEGSGVGGISSYLSAMELSKIDLSRVAVIAHHFYGVDPAAVDLSSLANLGSLGKSMGKPLFQTEMQADGFGTAVLIHHALVTEGASAYLQGVLAGPTTISGADASALITLGADDFTLEAPYHAMRHYALDTDPGWVRVGVNSEDPSLLASAWLAPDSSGLTAVLVNTGTTAIPSKLELGGFTFASTRVTRTVFDGSERSAELGALATNGVLNVPGRSIVTVAARN